MSQIFQKKKYYQNQETFKNPKRKLDIMIEQTLPASFNLDIWERISLIPPEDFILNQEDIKNILLSDEKLFQSFFFKFYTNHQHLNNWYILANSNQWQLKKYIFQNLLSKKYKQYRDLIHQFFDPPSGKVCEFRQQKNVQEHKKDSFHKITVGCKGDFSPKKWSVEGKAMKKCQQREIQDIQKEDYHELYLKTFGACDGSKYIYYDFNRHMKGINQKKKYNQFIRIKRHKVSSSNFGVLNLSLQKQKDLDSAIKSSNISFYTDPQTPFLHEGEETFENMKYCNVTVDPIGEIQKIKYTRELMWLRQTTKGLKKVKSQQTPFRFQLKRKKIL